MAHAAGLGATASPVVADAHESSRRVGSVDAPPTSGTAATEGGAAGRLRRNSAVALPNATVSDWSRRCCCRRISSARIPLRHDCFSSSAASRPAIALATRRCFGFAGPHESFATDAVAGFAEPGRSNPRRRSRPLQVLHHDGRSRCDRGQRNPQTRPQRGCGEDRPTARPRPTQQSKHRVRSSLHV